MTKLNDVIETRDKLNDWCRITPVEVQKKLFFICNNGNPLRIKYEKDGSISSNILNILSLNFVGFTSFGSTLEYQQLEIENLRKNNHLLSDEFYTLNFAELLSQLIKKCDVIISSYECLIGE